MDVIDQARELGQAIAQSGEFTRMQQAQTEVEFDAEASKLQTRYQQKRAELALLMQGGQNAPQAVQEAAQALSAVEEQLTGNLLIQELMQAQQGFSRLISQVNQILKFYTTGETAAPDGGCASGGCSGCGGCGNG